MHCALWKTQVAFTVAQVWGELCGADSVISGKLLFEPQNELLHWKSGNSCTIHNGGGHMRWCAKSGTLLKFEMTVFMLCRHVTTLLWYLTPLLCYNETSVHTWKCEIKNFCKMVANASLHSASSSPLAQKVVTSFVSGHFWPPLSSSSLQRRSGCLQMLRDENCVKRWQTENHM